MWQSDVMSSFYMPYGNNGSRMAYLVGMIDDHSRRDMHSEFYFDATLPRLEDTLRKAVTKHGAPVSIYVDNGKIFVSEQFKLICARLGIRIKFATPFNAAGKGKIERYWQTVQTSFLPEVRKQPVKSLSELNELWDTFKEFNKDILISILDDLSLKASDFNRNFLYYIARIRSNYLEKLSKFKEVTNE